MASIFQAAVFVGVTQVLLSHDAETLAAATCVGGTYLDKHVGRSRCCSELCEVTNVIVYVQQCQEKCPNYDQDKAAGEARAGAAKEEGPESQVDASLALQIALPIIAAVAITGFLLAYVFKKKGWCRTGVGQEQGAQAATDPMLPPPLQEEGDRENPEQPQPRQQQEQLPPLQPRPLPQQLQQPQLLPQQLPQPQPLPQQLSQPQPLPQQLPQPQPLPQQLPQPQPLPQQLQQPQFLPQHLQQPQPQPQHLQQPQPQPQHLQQPQPQSQQPHRISIRNQSNCNSLRSNHSNCLRSNHSSWLHYPQASQQTACPPAHPVRARSSAEPVELHAG